MEITIEEMQKKFDSLPEELQWAIMSIDVDEKMTDIGKREGLNVEQMGQLALETNAVMFGFYPPDGFEDALRKNLGLPADKIKKIVTEINEDIFKNIREKLREAQTEVVEEISSNDEDDSVLKSAGIEIAPETKQPAPDREDYATKENRADMLAKVEKPESIVREMPKQIERPKIVTLTPNAKIIGNFKIPMEKTEYKLSNMTKDGEKGAPVIATPQIEKTNFPKVDPYRELPE